MKIAREPSFSFHLSVNVFLILTLLAGLQDCFSIALASEREVYVYVFKGEARYTLNNSTRPVGKEDYLKTGGVLRVGACSVVRIVYKNGKYYDVKGPASVELRENQVIAPRNFGGRRARVEFEASHPSRVSLDIEGEGEKRDGDTIDRLVRREALYRERVAELVNEKDRLRYEMERVSPLEKRYLEDLRWQFREIEEQIFQLNLAIEGVRNSILEELRRIRIEKQEEKH